MASPRGRRRPAALPHLAGKSEGGSGMNLTIERYVLRVNRRLRPHVPPKHRRAIRRDLRAHLRDAAADVGAHAAVEGAVSRGRRSGLCRSGARPASIVEALRGRRRRRRGAALNSRAPATRVPARRGPDLGRLRPVERRPPPRASTRRSRANPRRSRGRHRVAYVVVPLRAFLVWSRIWRAATGVASSRTDRVRMRLVDRVVQA